MSVAAQATSQHQNQSTEHLSEIYNVNSRLCKNEFFILALDRVHASKLAPKVKKDLELFNI
jgi:hypothetical protein